MRDLARLAKSHPVAARIIIVISRCLLFLIAWFLGREIAGANNVFSPLWLTFFLLLLFATGALYPKNPSAANFFKRKVFDLVVCLAGFCLTICFSVQLHKPVFSYQSVLATVPTDSSAYNNPDVQRLLSQHASGEKIKFSKKEKRLIRKEFNHQLIMYAKAKVTNDNQGGDRAVVIILACIAAVGLLFLVSMLACSLACNGSDAAAIAVLVFGTAAIVFGLIAIIRSTRRKKVPPQGEL